MQQPPGAAIAEAVLDLSRAFKKAGLAPPAALVLANAHQGWQLVRSITEQLGPLVTLPADTYRQHRSADGCLQEEVLLYGVTIRWPIKSDGSAN